MNPQDSFTQRLFEALSARLPSGAQELRQELRQNLSLIVADALKRSQLVNREEFDIQTRVLARSRSKLEAMERTVAELEQRVSELHGAASAVTEQQPEADG